jgi:lysophospholipase L1-like esterase
VRYLALGDSYTVGEGVPTEEQWPRQLAALLRERGTDLSELVMIARTAWTTDELHDAIDEAPPKGKFDLVTLMVGVNDQYRARALAQFDAEFQGVLRRALSFARKASRVIAVSIPDWGAAPFADGRDRNRITREIEAFNDRAREIAQAAGAHWVDVLPSSQRMAEDRSLAVEDGLHPSGVMYGVWAELVLPVALSVLARSRA